MMQRQFLNQNILRILSIKKVNLRIFHSKENESFLKSNQLLKFGKTYLYKLIIRKIVKAQTERLIKQQFKHANIQIEYYNHYLCHATLSYYSSSFDEALCITVDGHEMVPFQRYLLQKMKF